MSLEDLEQALFEAKWDGADEDAGDIIANMLELPRGVVERVVYAWATIKEEHPAVTGTVDEGPSLARELREALDAEIAYRAGRTAVRRMIQSEHPTAFVKVATLIGKDVGRICDGCPLGFRCVTENLSTPAVCAKRGPPWRVNTQVANGSPELDVRARGRAAVVPTKLEGRKVHVTCDHPKGTWVLDLKDVT